MDVLRHTPKPVVEEHYHIIDLINAQERRTRERVMYQDRAKAIDSFLKEVAGFKDIDTLDFYCEKCDREFVARARKHIDSWSHFASYKIKHTCGEWCSRHITDRFKDKYFFKSRFLAHQRVDQHNDTLQPFESGFNMLYGKK